MKKTLLALFLLICFSGIAQKYANKNYYLVDNLDLEALSTRDRMLVDSCLKVYYVAKDDTSKIKALEGICAKMIHEDWSKYQFYQYELIEKALKNNNTQHKKPISKFYKEAIGSALNNIGIIYMQKGNIPVALDYYHKSLKIQEELEDKKGMASSFNNIGSIYKNQGDTLKALEYLHKSLKIFKEIGYKKGVASSYNNIGLIHRDKYELQKAMKYIQKSIKIRKELEDKSGLATCYNNIGLIYLDKDSVLKAKDYFYKSLKLRKELKNKKEITTGYNNLGGLFLDENLLDSAEFYLKKGYKLSQELGLPSLIRENAKSFSQLSEKQGDFQKAFKMYILYIKMRDSIINKKTQKDAFNQEARYKYEKQKALDDKENEKLLIIEREEKEKQQIITYASIGGVILILIFLFFVFNRLKVTQKQKTIIEETNEELNQTNEEIAAQRDEIEFQKIDIELKHKHIQDSINYAERIQNAILPVDEMIKSSLKESFVLYKPKDIVAGDFYWLEQIGSKTLFAAADCTGHGVPGAMVSVVCNNALNRSVREYSLTEPASILNKTREIVLEEFSKSGQEVKDGMDIAFCSLSNNVLEFSGANNPLWIIRSSKFEPLELIEPIDSIIKETTDNIFTLFEIKANKQPIGKFIKPKLFTNNKVNLQKGDALYIFSDGFIDQFGGEKDRKFGSKRLKELLISIQDKSMVDQKEILNKTFQNWMKESKAKQIDDVCVMGVRV